MLYTSGYMSKVFSANIVKNKLINKVNNIKCNNTKLFADKLLTIVISLNK
jgi:hypothetical protein